MPAAIIAKLVGKVISKKGKKAFQKPDVDVQVTGQEKLTRIGTRIHNQGKQVKNEMAVFIRRLAFLAESESKKSVRRLEAIDTGRLLGSIGVQGLTRDTATIGTDVNYAFFVHEGMGSNTAKGRRPFMEEGAMSTAKQAEKIGGNLAKKIGINITK